MPVFVFAGLSPFTQAGEAKGSRNEFIQWIQDVHDQRGIVRQYVKYDNEFRTARNVKPIVHRSLQFAHSDPKGPVYLVGAREVMEEESERVTADAAEWPPIAPAPLAEAAVAGLADAMQKAARPLIVTSYLGRNAVAATELVRLCGRLGVGVLELCRAQSTIRITTRYIKAITGTIRSRTRRWRKPISFSSLTATSRGFQR